LRGRRGGFRSEDTDFLRLPSIQHDEIVLCQISDGAVVIANDDTNLDQVSGYVNLGSLGCVGRCQSHRHQQQCDHNRQAATYALSKWPHAHSPCWLTLPETTTFSVGSKSCIYHSRFKASN
jgi:hypothetical protein